MIKIQFDFTKNPPHIDINKSMMSSRDIPLLQTAFYQMSLGKKFLKKFILEASGVDLKITPVINEEFKNIAKAQGVFKNLMKEASFAYYEDLRDQKKRR